MSDDSRVRMTQVIDGEQRVIRVQPRAVGLHTAGGWQVDDTPEPPRKAKPARKAAARSTTSTAPEED